MILNMTGGAGGSGKSDILVHAPAGSVVSIENQDGVRKDTGEKNGVWTFKGCGIGTWTVYASLGGQSATAVVEITEEGQLMRYEVFLAYTRYLIDGEPITDEIIGGWVSEAKKIVGGSNAVKPTVAQNSGYIKLTQGSGGGVYRASNPIDLTNYSSIVLEGYLKYNYTNGDRSTQCLLGCFDTLVSEWSYARATAYIKSNGGNEIQGEHRIDISSLSGVHYIMFGLNNTYAEVRIDALYLEA